MRIQLTLDANGHLHIIPISVNDDLVFEYNYRYRCLKSNTLINAFLLSLPDAATKHIDKLLSGVSLRLWYDSYDQELILCPIRDFNNNLRKFRYQVETNKDTSTLYKRFTDTGLLYIPNWYYLVDTLPKVVDKSTEYGIFEIKSDCLDNMSIRLHHRWITNKSNIIKTNLLDDGGLVQLLEFSKSYVPAEICHINKDIHSLKTKCINNGWHLDYELTDFPNVMILAIYRYSFKNVVKRTHGRERLTLKTICYESYEQLH
jgi:hypothetical protein